MPYQLQKAYVRPKGLENDWQELDLSQLDIGLIYERYSRVILEVIHTSSTDTLYVDMNHIRGLIGAYIGFKSLATWLVENGDNTLPTQETNPSLMTSYPVLYSDAVLAGYKIKTVDRSKHHETDLLETEKRDLLLQKDGIDFRVWGRYMLATVNGMVHRVGGSVEGLYVMDGGFSYRQANLNQIGLLSFKDVGSTEVIPITPDMVYKNDQLRQRYSDYAMIKSPVSLQGKTPVLVLGGYMHVLDDIYTVTGDKSIRINMNRMPLIERYFDSVGLIDLSMLGLETGNNNPDQISTSQLWSDQTILAWLTLPQSFIVLLDTPNVYRKRIQVESTKFAGRYLTELESKRLPLVGPMGRLLEYRSIPYRYRKVLATMEHFTDHLMMHTTPYASIAPTVDNANYSYDPVSQAHAHFLEFGRYD